MAVTEIDIVVKTIRESRDPDIARERLMQLPLRGLEAFVRRAGRPEAEIALAAKTPEYHLSERQARAILEMRLQRLTGLEQEKLASEYGTLCDEIARLRAILADESLLMTIIKDELAEIRSKHDDPRRTEIVEDEAEILIEDLIQEEDVVVTISHSGYIKRTPFVDYKAQKRGGKGNRGMEARDDDFVNQLFIASTHTYVFFFSNRGRLYVKKVYEIPQAARSAKGRALVNFIGLGDDERIAAITPVPGFLEDRYVITLTRRGQIKKTSLVEYQNIREKGIIGVKIAEDDQLLTAAVTDGNAELIIATKQGQSIRFSEDQVRPMGRNAGGVKAIDLLEGDEVVGLATTDPERSQVLAICERGYGKRTPLEEFRAQNRGGKGIILIDCSERNGPVVGISLVKPDDEVMLITDRGQTLRTRVDEIRETGRNAQGVKVMRVDDDERVVAIEAVGESRVGAALDDEDDGSGSTPPDGTADSPAESEADSSDGSGEGKGEGEDSGGPKETGE
jgi:DNA gyrase subunit A